MVSIIKAEEQEGHYLLSVKAHPAEWAELKGNMHNIHLIPEEHATVKTTLFKRGIHGSSKYLLIPKCLRKNAPIGNEACCSMIEREDKIIITYFLQKMPEKENTANV
jgi:hypothetical protein